MTRLLLALGAAAVLAGCETTGTGSVAGGACRAFPRPSYVVLGRTAYDQDWIDQTVETGVGACAWPRPAARPANLDQDRRDRAPGVKAAPAPRPRGLVARVKARVRAFAAQRTEPSPPAFPANQVAPIAPTPAPPVVVSPPPPPPRSKIDQLLHPDRK